MLGTLLVAMSDNLETIRANGQPILGKCDKKEVPLIGRERVKCDIIDMLTENTGVSMLDSGGAYGRAWQRNRLISNWEERPVVNITAYQGTNKFDGDYLNIEISYDLYHFLSGVLEVDEDVLKLREEFEKFAFSEEEEDNCWSETIENFEKKINQDQSVYETGFSYNTYNDECDVLSQIIQFYHLEHDGENYIFLQIHGGCDVRGGYTDPVIFKAHYEDLFCSIERGYGNFYFVCPDCGKVWIEKDYGKIYPEKEYNEIKEKVKNYLKEQRNLNGEKINNNRYEEKRQFLKEVDKRLKVGQDIEIRENIPYHKGCKSPLDWE